MHLPLEFSVDPLSFAFGFVVATILWWSLSRSRPLWKELRARLRTRQAQLQGRRMSVVEEDCRRETLRRAQGLHLAASLFALEDIVQEPELLAPPAFVEPGGRPPTDDVVTLTVPYMPSWPELSALYGGVTLSFGEALAGGANLAIIGQPGIGKSVALAWLATLSANRDETLGLLREAVPFLLHVADLDLPSRDASEALTRISEMASERASLLEQGRMADFVKDCFHTGRALLLLDGFDELTPQGQQDVTEYLSLLLHSFPETRIVTTGAPEYLDGLTALDFVPLALAAWSPRRQSRFIRQWMTLWPRIATADARSETQPAILDPLLLEGWLGANDRAFTPLELTLRAWAACTGDLAGPHILDAIAAHVRRLAPSETPMAALETLAMQVNLLAQPVFDPRKARGWVKDFERLIEATPGSHDLGAQGGHEVGEPAGGSESIRDKPDGALPASPTSPGLLGKLASTGLLVGSRHNRARFVHPVIGGYLAGRALGAYKAGDTLVNQPEWIGKFLTMRYFAALGDVNALADLMLQWSRLPMHRRLFDAARWLRDAQPSAPWRNRMIAALTRLIENPDLPLSLRGQALTALVCSNDPGVASLCRQLMRTSSAGQQQLAALGSGAVRDERAVGDIAALLDSPNAAVRRAACLSLVAIGSTRALEHVGNALLQGDDELRRAAAEALANHPDEGYAMLRDGAAMPDILLRRATAYGLGRIARDLGN